MDIWVASCIFLVICSEVAIWHCVTQIHRHNYYLGPILKRSHYTDQNQSF